MGWQDSNLRMAASKAAALPLGDTPPVHRSIREREGLLSDLTAGGKSSFILFSEQPFDPAMRVFGLPALDINQTHAQFLRQLSWPAATNRKIVVFRAYGSD